MLDFIKAKEPYAQWKTTLTEKQWEPLTNKVF